MTVRELKILPLSSTTTIDIAPGANFVYKVDCGYNFGSGSIAVTANGAPLNGTSVMMYCDFTSATNYNESSANCTLLGTVVPGELATTRFKCIAIYDGSWEVYFTPEWKEDDIITTAHIQDNAISTAKIANNAVTTAKILDANVTEAKIASNAVTTAKINDGAVTLAKMDDMSANGFIGNDNGASQTPQELSLTETRTLLGSSTALTNHVTGSASEVASTGVTTISTTISSDTIVTSMLKDENKIRYEMVYGILNCVTGGSTAEAQIKLPYNCYIREAVVSVIDAVSHNVDITLTNHGGTSLLKTTKTITTGNAANFLLNIDNPTDIDSYPTDTNNLFSAAQTIKVGSDAGANTPTTGKLFFQIAIHRED